MPCQQRNMASHKVKWFKVNGSGLIPKPRHGHRAVAVKELMIIFGGGNEGIIDELHAYNTVSNQWFCPVVKGDEPPGAAAFGLAADSTRLLFHGGMIEYGYYSDTLYELQVGPYFATGNISSKWEWKKLKPKAPRFAQAPSARIGHSFTFINGKYYLFGGLCQDIDQNKGGKECGEISYSNDLYILEFRGNSCFWEMPHVYGTAPSPRESHTAVGHVDSLGNSKLLIYGGMAGVRLGDISVLDLSSMTWTQPDVDGPIPLPRSLHSSSVVGDKMYVFGGWVPIQEESPSYMDKWVCTNSLARLNLNTYKWEEIDLDCRDGCPEPRAGHCAVVVGTRMYIWSGRDGYARMWNVQVCCKDLWYLEVGKPPVAAKVQLIKAGVRVMELTVPEVEFCDHFILQVMRYSVPAAPKAVNAAPAKRKKKIARIDWADDDIGPMLPPTSPLPAVPLPPPQPAKADKPLPTISFCDDQLPSFLVNPPKPPLYTVPRPKPPPRLPPPMVHQPQMVQPPQPFLNHGRPLIHHAPPMSQHQPLIKHNHVIMSTAPSPLPSNAVQFVPVREMTSHFPKPDLPVHMQMKPPSMVISKPFQNSEPPPKPTYPSTIDFTQMKPVPMKAIPQGATLVKVVNSSVGSFSNVKVQPPPQVFSTQGQHVPPPKHTIIINKPVNKLPGQQIVVVSSAPVHRPPQTIQTIQTVARPDANYFPPQKQMKITMGNGVKSFPVGRLSAPAPTRVQVQSPAPMYKTVKLQVNGKTLNVMMPLSTASVTPGTSTQSRVIFHQANPSQTVLTSSCQPKVAVRQETAPVNPPRQVTVFQPNMKQQNSNVESARSNEVNDNAMGVDGDNEKKQTSQTIKITGARPVAGGGSEATGQPTPSCSSVVTPASSKSTEAAESAPKPEPEKVSLPDPPSNIKISKTSDGAIISWCPPSKGPQATGYSVNLGVKADGENQNKITFINVYNDVHTKTKILQDVLDRATLSFPKPTIIFRVFARNESGSGPATQVRWLQDPKIDCSAGPSTKPDHA